MVATSMPGQRTGSQCEVSKCNDLSSLDAKHFDDAKFAMSWYETKTEI